MKDLFKLLLVLFVLTCLNTTLCAQQNKKTDSKLWLYNDASDIDSVHLQTYYKIEQYVKGDSYWTNYMNTFETNGLVYFQVFLAIPMYSKKEKLPYSSYTKEDTLMMFLNEDFSYRKQTLPVPERHIYAWYGLVFEKTVSSTLSAEEKEAAKLQFTKAIPSDLWRFQHNNKIEYFQRIDSGYEYDSYMKAINPKTKVKPIIFIPKYEPFK